MKCKIPEISWHNRDPVLSVDLHPKLERCTDQMRVFRLASGGTDAHVLIWYLQLNNDSGDVEIDLAADLSRHQRAVNAVKWSPNGELLASGDDESIIFIWKQKSESETLNLLDNTNSEDKEIWLTLKVLRGHMEDVYDLSWAPNSQLLVSGSVDNTAMIWDVHKGKSLAILNDHKGFVQGVAWDPFNKYIATLSTDRYLRIFDIQTKKVVYRINKSILPVAEDHDLYEKHCRLYHDDTLQTFFRRLTFTPDGKLLITPAGFAESADCTHPMETTYIYSRYDLKQPAIVLPSPEQYTVAVRCCPMLFQLRPHSEEFKPIVPLPYRMIFAVATRCSVYFYDTQQIQPFAVISNIHYTRLTDITWSPDGRVVVVSSTDGFCSLISFNNKELGEEYTHKPADLLAQEQEQDLYNNQTNKKKQSNKNKAMNEQKSPKQKTANVQASVEEEKKNNVEYKIDMEIIASAEKFATPAMNAKPIELYANTKNTGTKDELVSIEEGESNEQESLLKDDEEFMTDAEDEDSVEVVIKSKIKDDGEARISDEDEIKSETEDFMNEIELVNSKATNGDDVEKVGSIKVEGQKGLAYEEMDVDELEKAEIKEVVEQQNILEAKQLNKEIEVGDENNPTIEKENKEETFVTDEPKSVINVEETQQLSAKKNNMVSPMSHPNYLSPSERTPRRVALRTISTPKSKKKLLE